MKVGITLGITKEKESMYINGIKMNAIFSLMNSRISLLEKQNDVKMISTDLSKNSEPNLVAVNTVTVDNSENKEDESENYHCHRRLFIHGKKYGCQAIGKRTRICVCGQWSHVQSNDLVRDESSIGGKW